MRKLFHVCFLIFLITSAAPGVAAIAAQNPSATPAAPASSAVSLTPAQARDALAVLNDPKRRAQVADTLQAIAAAGELSAPPAASAAVPASAPAAASGAATLVPTAFTSNGLASQMARQGAHLVMHLGKSLRGSVAALLDVASVRAWWNWQLTSPHARAVLVNVTWSLLAALLPALALEWLARRVLRRAYQALAARREQDELDRARETAPSVGVAPPPPAAPSATPPLPMGPVPPVLEAEAQAVAPASASAKDNVIEAQGKRNATLHWTLLQRLPRALLVTRAAARAARGVRRRGERADVDLHRRRHAARPRARLADRRLLRVPGDRDHRRLLSAPDRAAPAPVAHGRRVGRFRATLDRAHRQRGRRAGVALAMVAQAARSERGGAPRAVEGGRARRPRDDLDPDPAVREAGRGIDPRALREARLARDVRQLCSPMHGRGSRWPS